MGRRLRSRTLLWLAAAAVACGSGAPSSGGLPPAEPGPSAPAPEPAGVDAGAGVVHASDGAATPDAPRGVTIAASGDLVLNPLTRDALRASGEGGYEAMLAGFAASVDEPELTFVNLETPLVDDVVPLRAGWPPVLGALPGLADALATAGVDIVSVANNHAYDQSHSGLQRTLDELHRVGVRSVGAAPQLASALEPTVVDSGGLRVGFLAFTRPMNRLARARGHHLMHVPRLWDEERVLPAVEAARPQVDVLVLALHWSSDFVMAPDREQRQLARELVAAGADLIIGTGPHVLQPVERLESPRGEALVAYSLGNLVSGMGRNYRLGHPPHGYVHPANVRPEARDGVLLRVRLEVGEGGVSFPEVTGVPLWTVNSYLAHRASGAPLEVRVIPLAAAPEEVQEERLPLISGALGGEVSLTR